MPEDLNNKNSQLDKLTNNLNAMHLAQLTAFAFTLPPLYFCREYLNNDEQTIIEHCKQRLLTLLTNQTTSMQTLTSLLSEKEYYSEEEARLRLGPEIEI